jgi:hypothetical protein
MMGLIKDEWFIFVVNGDKFEANIAQAIFVSPDIYQRLMDAWSILGIFARRRDSE